MLSAEELWRDPEGDMAPSVRVQGQLLLSGRAFCGKSPLRSGGSSLFVSPSLCSDGESRPQPRQRAKRNSLNGPRTQRGRLLIPTASAEKLACVTEQEIVR